MSKGIRTFVLFLTDQCPKEKDLLCCSGLINVQREKIFCVVLDTECKKVETRAVAIAIMLFADMKLTGVRISTDKSYF